MSSHGWGEPDGRTPLKYPDHHHHNHHNHNHGAGFVEPASFVPSHWQYEEDGKGSIADDSNDFPTGSGVDVDTREEDELTEDDYGELEIVLKYKGRSGSSIRSKSLKLTSRMAKKFRRSTLPKSEYPTEEPSLHGVYSAQDNRQICVLDESSGCVCKQFSPSIFRSLLAQTLNSAGLSTTSLLDGFLNQYVDQDCGSFAVSDHPTEENLGGSSSRQVSGAFGKKRLLSNASEENVRIQPSKKNPRLQADSTDGQDSADADDGNERHTCPYFKMYPERHLECGTKDLAQRPKIKSHIIKDHLKKSGIPTPPEIKSQKCDPWDRWCKWIVQETDKADRPVPNSTPDFYPILNYIVSAASEIPSEGLTCFSSVMLRLFKSIQANPGEWSSFVHGLEELEQSLNNPNASGAIPSSSTSRRTVPSQKEEEILTSAADDSTQCKVEAPTPSIIDMQPLHAEETPIAQYSTNHLSEDIHDQTYTHYAQPASSTFANMQPLVDDYSHSAAAHHHLPQHLFVPTTDFELSHWLVDYALAADHSQTYQPNRPQPETNYSYEPEPVMEKPIEPPMDHFSIPPGVGTNSKSLLRAAQSPRVRKRKNGTVRQESVEGTPLNDSAPASQIHSISVSSAEGEEKFEFSGRFSVSQFQQWLRSKFNFSFNRDDGRKLWCVDVREDIQVHAADGIRAHLKTWSTKGNFTGVPSFRIGTSASRTLSNEKWSKITPDFIEEIYANDPSMDDVPLIMRVRPDSQSGSN